MKDGFLFLVIIFLSFVGSSQKIDSTNYCEFYSMEAHYPNSSIKTNYLTKLEIAKIVYDEMEKLGYKAVFNFHILQLDSTTYVNSICYSEQAQFGFLFEEINGMIPDQKNRNVVSLYKEMTGFAYSETYISGKGEKEIVKIKDLPDNLHILKKENYWYQVSSDSEKNKSIVSKDFIINLLREDVKRLCSSISGK